MGNVKRVKYFTPEKKALISPSNKKKYDKYLSSNVIKNKDVKATTYKTYENYMTQFLVYLSENWDNIDLYSEEFFENALDIMEAFILFCQDTLQNNKKVINTKLSTVSSFYFWSLKRRFINRHPFDKQLSRMQGANKEKIINHYFLEPEQTDLIDKELKENRKKFDLQDRLLWNLMLDSANRVGAISRLTLSSLDMQEMKFNDIREKRGYSVEVVFEEKTHEILQEWLEFRKKEMDELKVDAIFITKYRNEYRPMTYSTIQYRVKQIGKIIGLNDFHCHCIRKTKGNMMYNETNNLELVSNWLNHQSSQVTKDSYIKVKSKTEERNQYKELRKKMISERANQKKE